MVECPHCKKDLTESGSCSLVVKKETAYLDCHYDPEKDLVVDNGDVSYDVEGAFVNYPH